MAQSRWPSAATAAAWVALAVFLAFPGVFLAGETLLLRDTSLYFWPTKEFLARRLAAGELPFWLPFAGSGQPFLANPKNSLLYPPQILFYVALPARAAFHALALTHLAAIGAGAWAWLRRVAGLGQLAAGSGALALVLSGFVLSSVEFHQHILALAWLAPLLLAAERVRLGASPRAVAAFAGSLAMLLLAGEPYIAVVAVGLAGAHLLGRARAGARLAPAARLAAGGAGGVLLAAPQLLVAALHLPLTARASADYARADLFAIPPARWLELLLPRFFGSPDRLDAWGEIAFGPQLHVSLYAGVVVSCAFAAAAFTSWRRALLGLALAGLVLAALPGAGALTSILPLSLIRYRAKYALLAVLAGPLALAVTVDALARGARAVATALLAAGAALVSLAAVALALRPAWSGLVAGFAARAAGGDPARAVAEAAADLSRLGLFAAIAALAGWLARRGRAIAAARLLAVAAVADLAAVAPAVNPTFPVAAASDPGPLVTLAARSPGRLWRDPKAADDRRARLDLSAFWEAARAVRTARALAAAPWGVRQAFDEDYDQMYLAEPLAAFERIDPAGRRRLLQRQGVTRILADSPPFSGLATLADDGFSGCKLYALAGAVPLLRAARPRPAADAGERLRLAASAALDPLREVVIEGLAATPGALDAGGAGEARLEVTGEGANRLEVATFAPGPFWLVWAETRAPGWSASIDGKPAPIRTADAGVMAVAVPAGEHAVVWRYTPPGLAAGLAVAGLTAAGLLLVARRPRRPGDGRRPERSAGAREAPGPERPAGAADYDRT